MIEKRDPGDRRRERRIAQAGRIRWRKAGTHTTFHGWLSDQSRSSVSFVASASARPTCGEEIEVIASNRSRQRYRVTRTASYDDRLSLIGCRSGSSRAVKQGTPSGLEVCP